MKKLVRVSLFVLMALTLSLAIGCKNDSEQEPVPANFEGEWKSTDGEATGEATVTIKDGNFTAAMDGLELEGTYTVDGNTATTSKVKIPAGLTGESEVSVSFTMKMVDGNDVMVLTVPAELTHHEPRDMTFGKPSSTEPDLTGTWTGKVVDEEETLRDVTIVFANNKVTLTLPGQTEPVTATVTQDGNFFTIRWGDDHEGGEFTGLISASGKVWLEDGSLFTRK